MRSGLVRWGIAVIAALVLVAAATIATVVAQRAGSAPGEGATATTSADATGLIDDDVSGGPTATPSVPECGNDTLVLGSLLPQTGDQAFLGPPGAAAVELALAEIDAAGGVLGAPVSYVPGDSGDAKTSVASETVTSQLAAGVQAIVGPAASAVTLNVIDQTTNAGIVLISPANTSPGLTKYADDGLYFRTIASDVAQGSVLATVARGLGLASGAVIARADSYGLGIQRAFEEEFVGDGGTVSSAVAYDPEATSFAAQVSEIAASDPEFVLVAGFGEASDILREMIRQGIGPDVVQVLLAEGSVSTTAYEGLPERAMEGVMGAVPAGDPSATEVKRFEKRLLEQSPQLTTFAYAGETYDAAILVALAADYAGCADGRAIAEALPLVANANPGSRVCATYAECRDVIAGGAQPNYEGVSGPRDFNEFGDARWASVEVIRYVSNVKYRSVEVVGPVEVPTT